MFDRTYRSNNYVTTTNNIFNIPDEYIVNHRNTNDDVDRMRYYIENIDVIDDYAIWLDILYPITKMIKNEVNNYIMKEYEGGRKLISLKVKDKSCTHALSIPKIASSISVIGESIRDTYNMDCCVMVNRDLFSYDGEIKIMIQLEGRIKNERN